MASLGRISISGFKAYDLRGRIPDELNPDVAYRVGRAYAVWLGCKRVVVGRDIRLSSAELCSALIRGLTDQGCDVEDIGLCGTEGVYFATGHLGADGGIMVTASHNPPDYNGMKFVREQSKPVSGDTGLLEIRALAEAGEFAEPAAPGKVTPVNAMADYLDHLMSYVDVATLKPLHLVCHAGNGGAGLIVDELEGRLPFRWTKLDHAPDGTFPNGVPNPMLLVNQGRVAELVRSSGADFGIAWDGDYDRCFFFDEHGTFLEGYYIVGLLAQSFIAQEPGARVLYDPRLTWNTIAIAEQAGGVPVMCKSGHAFMKAKMREQDAAYGGEMSAHHYFRRFFYCDSGMVPWLLVAQLVSQTGKTLGQLVQERIAAFPASGEINLRIPDAKAVITAVQEHVGAGAALDFTDGVSIAHPEWRMNLRTSNTEPLLRLNVESRGDIALMNAKTAEVLAFLADRGGVRADH
jgi:phosphomannomutase